MKNKHMMELADVIENKTVDMRRYITLSGYRNFIHGRILRQSDDEYIEKHQPTCKSVACIAGWCAWIHKEEYLYTGLCIQDFATKKLGLTLDQARHLFFPKEFRFTKLPQSVQKERALQVLRGEIKLTSDWLHNPIYVRPPKKLPKNLTSLLETKEKELV